MRFQPFCENFVYLHGQPISFAGRGYLDAPYASRRNLVLRCSRQVEKTTLLVNAILFAAASSPGTSILFCCPRDEQVGVFSRSRLQPAIEQSPLLRRRLLGKRARRSVRNFEFANGSQLFLRSCYHSADSARGVSANLLMIDEFQDIASGYLPVLQETLSHCPFPRTIITGTPKVVDNHLETVFQQSTACEWRVPCSACGGETRLDERALGLTGLECVHCHQPVEATTGRWVPQNPDAAWGDGFWVNHLMVPWLRTADTLARQQVYDLPLFTNECLGLPVALGDHIITAAEIEACAEQRPMAETYADVPAEARDRLLAGIDWGAGGRASTVLVIGYMDDRLKFRVLRFQRIAGREDPGWVLEEVARLCRIFRVVAIAADGGGTGAVYNRLLLDKLASQVAGFYAIFYGSGHGDPCQDGALWRWSVDRSHSMGNLFSRIKKRLLLFPAAQECRTYFPDFTNVFAEYDDHMRSIKYCHCDGQPDDALHATNYAQLLGLRQMRSA